MSQKTLNIRDVRGDFPALDQLVYGHPLVYLDSAATALKPNAVINRVTEYLRHETANVHRGAHYLSERATTAFEAAREAVRAFLNAEASDEIIFTRGTTEAINLVAQSFGRLALAPGDEIVISEMEHHSNIVPWQMIAQEKGCTIRVIPLDDAGQLMFEEYEKILGPKTKIVALTLCSNVLGYVVDVKKFVSAAHQVGAKVLVDAAQGVSQVAIDVRELGCDFLAFSGHKLFGPDGVGVLYGRAELLNAMPPYQGGGSMIGEVRWEKTTWAALPHKFEAGTPAISGVLGLATAIQYVQDIGFAEIQRHEKELLKYAIEQLSRIQGLQFYGLKAAGPRAPILAFNMTGAHASDLGSLLDQQGVAIRAGHHCCQPLMRRLGVPATARASFSIYNNRHDVDMLRDGLIKAKEIFS